MQCTPKVVNVGLCAEHPSAVVCPRRFGRAERRRWPRATSAWGSALGEDDPDKVLPFYSNDAVL